MTAIPPDIQREIDQYLFALDKVGEKKPDDKKDISVDPLLAYLLRDLKSENDKYH